jgi:hypothetical protein
MRGTTWDMGVVVGVFHLAMVFIEPRQPVRHLHQIVLSEHNRTRILHTRNRQGIARRLEGGQDGSTEGGGQPLRQVAVLDGQRHAKQWSTASCSKRSISLPGCLQH